MTGPDVLVQVEHVAGVVGALERRQPGELLRRVGAAHALTALVAERVDVDPARELVERGGAAPGRGHPGLVLRGIGPARAGPEFQQRVPVAERRVLAGRPVERSAVSLEPGTRRRPGATADRKSTR